MGKFLEKGEKFEIRDIENIHEVVYEGVYEAKPVSFPMNLTALAPIHGNLRQSMPGIRTKASMPFS